MSMQVDVVPKDCLTKYRVRSKRFHIYKAAARLWGHGMSWPDALRFIEDAFEECIVDA